MSYGNNARMPNSKKGRTAHSDTDSGSMGSNKGATGGLNVTPPGKGLRSDTRKKPTTTNRFPRGLA